MTSVGRALRLLVATALCAALLASTFWGSDDHFPIGPFRMFATRQKLDGAVSWYEVWIVGPDGTTTTLDLADVGLRRAEIEGQRPRFVDDPALLCLIARTAGVPDDAVEVQLVRRMRTMRDGTLTGQSTDRVSQTCRL